MLWRIVSMQWMQACLCDCMLTADGRATHVDVYQARGTPQKPGALARQHTPVRRSGLHQGKYG